MKPGVYLHVPFCSCKCNYCDFFSVRWDEVLKERYLRALALEVELRADLCSDLVFETVYIGGGTPSLFSPSDLEFIFELLHGHLPLDLTEVTVECNPGTVSEGFLRALSGLGVSRLSLGVQCFDDRLLKFLGRSHSLLEAIESFETARKAGFKNIGIDLIYGIPGQTADQWERTLHRAVSLEPDHVSTYELTVEEETPLKRILDAGRAWLPDEALVERMYFTAVDVLEKTGLFRYEISNFASDKKQCIHNLNYWDRGEYLGLGPSAHSFMTGSRSQNTASLSKYVDFLFGGESPSVTEDISTETADFERVMLALRTSKGIAASGLPPDMRSQVAPLVSEGLLEKKKSNFCLTSRGIMLSNEVFLRFM